MSHFFRATDESAGSVGDSDGNAIGKMPRENIM